MVPETLANPNVWFTAATLATPYLAGVILRVSRDIKILSAELKGQPLDITKDEDCQYLETPDEGQAEVIIKRQNDRFPQTLLLRTDNEDGIILNFVSVNGKSEVGLTDRPQTVVDGVQAVVG